MILRRLIVSSQTLFNKTHHSFYYCHSLNKYIHMHQSIPESLPKLLKATAIYNENDARLLLTIPFAYKNIKTKNFIFNRLPSEKIEQVIPVFEEKILKFVNSRLKKKNITVENLDIQILRSSQCLNGNVFNLDNSHLIRIDNNKDILTIFINEGNQHIINIEDSYYYLDINPPQLETVKLPADIRTGCIIYPEIEFKNASLKESKYTWYISKQKYSDINLVKSKIKWDYIHEGFLLKTDSDMEGKLLKLAVEPSDGNRIGDSINTIAPAIISQGPTSSFPYKLRQNYTQQYAPIDRVRVVSYNLLADTYARTKFSAEHLFPTCPSYALQINYRKQLLIDEVLGYKGDILCLQEVDRDLFREDLSNVFPIATDGRYAGNFAPKNKGLAVEGVATFYNTDKFSLIEHENLSLSEELSNNPLFNELKQMLESSNKELLQLLLDRTTVLQISTLNRLPPNDKECVVVGNTHFYFHPEADKVRLVHAHMCTALLQQRVLNLQNQEFQSSIIFCGDLNSTPESPALKFLTEGIVHTNSITRQVASVMKTAHVQFSSACGCPQFTNYAVSFNGCLDWIFYQPDNMTVMKVVDLPTVEQVTEFTALPSPKIPSDHLALVAELSFTQCSKPYLLWNKLKSRFGML